jgi:Protein of unknown function (DUF1566)
LKRAPAAVGHALRLALSASTIVAAAAGCNGILGIRAALDDEWDGGTLSDGAPAVSHTSMGASTSSTSGAGGSTSSGPPPDAGNIARWANWKMPNPPSIVPPLANQQNYDTSNTGIVIDNVTHLQWEGNPSPALYAYSEALSHCSGLQLGASGGGWRLPSRVELISIIDNTQQPRLDALAFGMPVNDGGTPLTFWASSLLAGDNTKAWVVDFGTTTNLVITDQSQPSPAKPLVVKHYARCVR